jgi:succinyl-CoA synthetase beta subunit
MNLHEYQAKELMKRYNVPVQEGYNVSTVDDAVAAASKLETERNSKWCVIKAQVHAGGRGKGGGVKLAKNADEVREKAGMQLITPQTSKEGKTVHQVLVAEDVYYPGASETKEYYLSILMDRAKKCNAIIYSTEGGMDIEEVAEHHPDKINKEWVHPHLGLQAFQARKIAFNLGLSGAAMKAFIPFITNLYSAYIAIDATLIEVNPCLKTSDDKIIAVDGKMNIDDNALYRHKDIEAMRDTREEDATEVEAHASNLNYVKLEGNVGCMVNGAGLAMATMDIIKLAGGDPANFLDVGGGANATTVEAGFRIIMKDPNVKAILVNIFGGIVRCDRIAEGVIAAYKSIGEIKIPIIVRLQGTNAEIAKKMIDDSGLKVQSAILLKEAAQLVTEAIA